MNRLIVHRRSSAISRLTGLLTLALMAGGPLGCSSAAPPGAGADPAPLVTEEAPPRGPGGVHEPSSVEKPGSTAEMAAGEPPAPERPMTDGVAAPVAEDVPTRPVPRPAPPPSPGRVDPPSRGPASGSGPANGAIARGGGRGSANSGDTGSGDTSSGGGGGASSGGGGYGGASSSGASSGGSGYGGASSSGASSGGVKAPASWDGSELGGVPVVAPPPPPHPRELPPSAPAGKEREVPSESVAGDLPPSEAEEAPAQTDPDDILAQLSQASVAFNVPGELDTHQPSEVQLLVDLKKSVEALQQEITAPGPVEGAQVRVARRMSAQLTGATFTITPITPEEQVLTRSEPTEWRWEVQATRSGAQRLYLTLTALVSVDGETSTRTIKTFNKTIEVDVAWREEAVTLMRDNLEWFWATFIMPAGFFFWQRRRKKGGGSKESAEEDASD